MIILIVLRVIVLLFAHWLRRLVLFVQVATSFDLRIFSWVLWSHCKLSTTEDSEDSDSWFLVARVVLIKAMSWENYFNWGKDLLILGCFQLLVGFKVTDFFIKLSLWFAVLKPASFTAAKLSSLSHEVKSSLGMDVTHVVLNQLDNFECVLNG